MPLILIDFLLLLYMYFICTLHYCLSNCALYDQDCRCAIKCRISIYLLTDFVLIFSSLCFFFLIVCFLTTFSTLFQLCVLAYFRLSLLQKHVRKVVGGFGKKSSVSTSVRKPGNTYGSPTAMM